MSDEIDGVEYFRRIGPEAMKRQIEAQMAEYERELAAYQVWLDDWRKRQGIERFDPETGEIVGAA